MTSSPQAPSRTRPARPQAILTVSSREWLTPNIVRIVAGGEGFEAFRTNDFTDKYVKIVFVDPALGLTPPYDLAALREQLSPEQRPVTRTYTVRHVDAERQSLTIDFVVHGDTGLAGPWAAAAEPGDTLTVMGAGGAYGPDPEADWYLLLGDESALPAISAALDALPDDARGVAYLETLDPDHVLPARVPPNVRIVWLDRGDPGTAPEMLADAVRNAPWSPGRVDVFAHGERESMKAIRAALKDRDLGGATPSLSGYWAFGRNEDRFQAEKREPIGKI